MKLTRLIKAGLPLGAQEVDKYIAAWNSLLDAPEVNEHELQRAMFDHMYGNLGVLDSKANSLVQLTGILVATYTVALSLLAKVLRWSEILAFSVGISYSVIAAVLCMLVIWVYWSGNDEIDDSDAHLRTLIRIRNGRTINFRRAWTFCLASILILLFLVLEQNIAMFHHNLHIVVWTVLITHLFFGFFFDEIAPVAAKLQNLRRKIARP